jgi:hypothetical protein
MEIESGVKPLSEAPGMGQEEEAEAEPSEEQEPSKEETSQEESPEPVKTSSEIEEANKKLYARMKKAEEELKVFKEKNKPKQETKEPATVDSLSLAKQIAALKDFSTQELDDIALISKAKGVSLEEAAQTEEVKILVAARREKVAREQKTPLPNSSSAARLSSKDVAKMTPEEHEEFERKYNRERKGREE